MQSAPHEFSLGHGPRTLPPLDAEHQKSCWILIGVLTVLLVAAYFNTLTNIAVSWRGNQYSHGWIIPIIAAGLLWLRRSSFLKVPAWQHWVGAALIALGTLMRVGGALFTTFTMENLSFIVCLMGVFVLVGGLPTFRWAGPAVAFLVFMLPLPDRVQDGLTNPLQRVASYASTYALVTMGVDARQEGNKILLGFNESPMNVADQCSGLRMLTIFTGLAVAMALISRDRPWWERVIVVLSAIPIALLVNVVRITLTGLLFSTGVNIPIFKTLFHDAPGLVMMPLAIGLLYLELQVLCRLVVDVPTADAPMAVG